MRREETELKGREGMEETGAFAKENGSGARNDKRAFSGEHTEKDKPSGATDRERTLRMHERTNRGKNKNSRVAYR